MGRARTVLCADKEMKGVISVKFLWIHKVRGFKSRLGRKKCITSYEGDVIVFLQARVDVGRDFRCRKRENSCGWRRYESICRYKF